MDWLMRLLDTSVPVRSHAHLADNWGTCAVGEVRSLCPGLLVFSCHSPVDPTLARLGLQFWRAVLANKRPQALALLLKIRRRALKLRPQ